jgi:hypothetical protein
MRKAATLVLGTLLAVAACANRPPAVPPETGTITVGVTAAGPDVSAIELRVEAGTVSGTVRADGGVFTARNVPAGDHVVRLTGVPSRCTVDGSPERRVTVRAQRTTALRFALSCG